MAIFINVVKMMVLTNMPTQMLIEFRHERIISSKNRLE